MTPTRPTGIVAIGASAGGLRPLREFFRALPSDTGASFVVVQHLSPDERSLTPEILENDTEMPCRPVQEGMGLDPDTIHFLPPGASLTLEGGVLHLRQGEDREPTRSVIDTFLTSVSRELGPTVIGILLSGTGSDGTRGMQSVKDHGGVTLVEDPVSAEFDGMPLSAIRAGTVDYQGGPAELADKVADVLTRWGEESSVTSEIEIPESAIVEIAETLKQRMGHDFAEYKRGTLSRRVRRRLLLSGTDDPNEYARSLSRNPAEVEALGHDLMIGVTEFFRDPDSWSVFSRTVMPELFEESNSRDDVRAWVLGCATGEEAYSLAILFDEYASGHPNAPEATIFATDINEAGLAFAREGLYSEGIADHLTPERMERYFTSENDHHRVAKRLRERIVFAAHNVLRDPPFSRQSIITCRNLLIYLEPRAQEHVLRVLAYSLEPGGYLFLGGAETLTHQAELFDPVDADHRLFRRNHLPAPVPVTPRRGVHPIRRPPGELSRAPETKPPPHRADPRRTLERALLDGYGPAAALINSQDEVLQLFGPTRHYFEPSAARGGTRLIDMALPGLQHPLRSALKEARESEAHVSRKGVQITTGGRLHVLDLTIRPAPQVSEGEKLLLVILQERVAPVDHEEAAPDGAGGDASAAELEEELRQTRARLQATIEERESTNEELQSTNEELLSVNEELQTSTEEALSINEELNTVNAELKMKVEELDRAHADLENLFRSTGIPTVFLDKVHCIRRFTPTAARLFSIRSSDQGRPIDEIAHRFSDGGLSEMIDQVIETLEPAESEVFVKEDDAWFTMRIAPYRTAEDVIEGVVLTFTEVTRIKLSEQRLDAERRFAEGVIDTVRDPLAVLDPALRVVSWNEAFLTAVGRSKEEVEGRRFADLGDWGEGEANVTRRLETILPKRETLERHESQVVLPGTGPRIFSFSGRILPTERKDEKRILLLARDVTDQRERERRHKEEARNRNWFLAMLGHELRNPLAVVRNCTTALQEGNLEPEQRENLLDIANRQVAHITRLITDLLDISRITVGELVLQMISFDLGRLIRETVEDHRSGLEEAGLEVSIDVPGGELPFYGDPHRVAQAVANLMDNARKYTPEEGAVRLRVKDLGGEVEVAVEDTGIGIDPDAVAEIFEPFRQGDEGAGAPGGGLGVGLALVRSIAEAHGGTVTAESAGFGKGSRFVLRLPVRQPESGDGSSPSPPAPSGEAAGPRRVLIVEDDHLAAETTALLLKQAGHSVEMAASGEAALELIEKDPPDVVLCDLGLPGGMSGYDVARELRARPEASGIRLVALTGYGQEEDRSRAFKAGFEQFLVKPVSVEELRSAIAASSGADQTTG